MEDKKKLNKKSYIIIGQTVVIIILIISLILLFNKVNKISENYIQSNNINLNKEENTNVNNNNNNNNNDGVTISKTEEVEKVKENRKLNLNEKATKEGKYELVVKEHRFSKVINPPNTNGYYSYYEAKEDGHQYLEVKYDYKNLAASGVEADDVVSMRIKYADKYEYPGFSIIEDDESDFTYSNITSIEPLTTGKLHYLFDVPDVVANGTESIILTLKCGNEVYDIKLR